MHTDIGRRVRIAISLLTIIPFAHASSPGTVDTRLVAQYLFDGDYSDASGNGQTGTEAGTFFNLNGDTNPLANLMAFDAERGLVYSYGNAEVLYDWGTGGNPLNNAINLEQLQLFPILSENAGVTLMTWIKREAVNSIPNDGTIDFTSVIHLGTGGNNPVATLAINIDGMVSGFIEGQAPDDGQVLVTGDTFVPPNEWHHVAIVFDRAADTATTYVDGVPQASPIDISVVDDDFIEWERALIGNFGPSGRAFVGQLDDTRIYYGTLTNEEIADIVSANIAPEVGSFTVDTDFLASAGNNVNLSWSATGQCELSIEPNGTIDNADTELVVSPTETTTYTLTARNGSASVSRELTVVVAEAPQIANFTTSRMRVNAGDLEEFDFDVTGATTLSIDQDVDIDTPTTVVTTTTTYTLSATNAIGTSTSEITIEVIPITQANFLIDFGSYSFAAGRPNRSADDGNFWNILLNYRDGKISQLIDNTNDTSKNIALEVTDGFDTIFSSAAVDATAYTVNAVRDGFATNVLLSDGRAELRLSRLDPTGATLYDLRIFGSLNSEVLNDPSIPDGLNLDLITRYTIVGAETTELTLNGADNLHETARARGIVPAADGSILIQMRPENPINLLTGTGSAGSGINTLQISSRLAPPPVEILSIVYLPNDASPSITWRSEVNRNYAVDRSSTLSDWMEISNTPIGIGPTFTWQDPSPLTGTAFYRIRTLEFNE